ncbi:MAG: signal transduction histidine kinase, partial [uncultured bacterium]
NGKVTNVIFNASLYQNADGLPAGVFVVARDITELEIASEKIKGLLAEKELILKEVHHRIKNNMNTVAGIMYMQANTLKEDSAIAALNDAQSRVLSMMLLYDKLYISHNFNKLSAREYLSTLVDEIIDNFPNKGIVRIEKNIDDFILDTKKMSDLGIFINEILTNSMKYAFTGRISGIINVSALVKDNRLTISVADNGIGIPESVNIENSSSFGLQLLNMMAMSLNGGMKIERDNGTKFILEFNL